MPDPQGSGISVLPVIRYLSLLIQKGKRQYNLLQTKDIYIFSV